MRAQTIIGGLTLAAVATGFGFFYMHFSKSETVTNKHLAYSKVHALEITDNNTPPPNPAVIDGVKLRYNPYLPSDGPYPQLAKNDKLWIDVSIGQQLLYIFSGSKRLYTTFWNYCGRRTGARLSGEGSALSPQQGATSGDPGHLAAQNGVKGVLGEAIQRFLFLCGNGK